MPTRKQERTESYKEVFSDKAAYENDIELEFAPKASDRQEENACLTVKKDNSSLAENDDDSYFQEAFGQSLQKLQLQQKLTSYMTKSKSAKQKKENDREKLLVDGEPKNFEKRHTFLPQSTIELEIENMLSKEN